MNDCAELDPFRPLDPVELGSPSLADGAGSRDGWELASPAPTNDPDSFPAHRLGKPAAWWFYKDAKGRRLCVVCRFDHEGGKDILPLTFWRHADGRKEWRWKALPAPRPLYRLDELAARPDAPVMIAEGEKAADAAAKLFPDYVVTTSPNGAKSADKADWSKLAGRRVIVWPDHDDEGRAYAADVCRLVKNTGAVQVAVVTVPPTFPPKWDLADPPPAAFTVAELRQLVDLAKEPAIEQQQEPPVPSNGTTRTLPLVWFPNIEPAIHAADFVEGMLGSGQMSVTYGESNSGKTFFACDVALHVAFGWEWFGRQVERGGVIYVAAEGSFGIRNRVAAFRKHYGIEPSADAPFAIIPTAVNLRDPDADTGALIATIRGAAARISVPVRLIVIDTLSRAMAGGNENASDDMGALVANADQIRQATGAHFMFVHHSGKEAARGARGHSLLRAATDTEIEVTRDKDAGVSAAKITKQRDLPVEGEFAYRLEVVELGTNQRGKTVTSCVVMATDGVAVRKAAKLSDGQRIALEQLKNCLADHSQVIRDNRDIPPVSVVRLEEWREYLRRAGVTDRDNSDNERSQWSRIKKTLSDKGVIRSWDGYVWLVRQTETGRDNGEASHPEKPRHETSPFRDVSGVSPELVSDVEGGPGGDKETQDWARWELEI